MDPDAMGIQQAYAERAVGQDVLADPMTVDRALDCLVDWFGVAIASANAPVVGLLRELEPGCSQLPADGSKRSRVFGDARCYDPTWAARVNGTAGHAQDFDDTHASSLVHVSSAVWPALLSGLAYTEPSGRDLLSAYVVGVWTCEVLGSGAGSRLLREGLHPTATLGVIAAAAATARLFGSDVERCATALGLAASTSYGTLANFGTMAKPLQAGNAAASGLTAARLARQGITAGRWVDRHADNAGPVLRSLLSAASDVAAVIADESTVSVAVRNVAHKPYAACLLTHAAIDGALTLASTVSARGGPPGIQAVQVRAAPQAVAAAGIPRPTTGYEGKFSLAYCVATALARGNVPARVFADDFGADQQVEALLPRISVEAIDALGDFEVDVEVTHDDGSTSQAHATSARGQPTQPLSAADIDAKFHDNLAGVATTAEAETLLARLRELPGVTRARRWADEIWQVASPRPSEVTR